jgi:hypothetical protein
MSPTSSRSCISARLSRRPPRDPFGTGRFTRTAKRCSRRRLLMTAQESSLNRFLARSPTLPIRLSAVGSIPAARTRSTGVQARSLLYFASRTREHRLAGCANAGRENGPLFWCASRRRCFGDVSTRRSPCSGARQSKPSTSRTSAFRPAARSDVKSTAHVVSRSVLGEDARLP